MKNVKKIKWMILALAGLALAGSVMTAEAADVNSQGKGKRGAPDFYDSLAGRGTAETH